MDNFANDGVFTEKAQGEALIAKKYFMFFTAFTSETRRR